METTMLLRGLALGLLIAAPVGPIGLLCIRRTLDGGRALGLLSGLGAATADALYGAVAGLGLTFVSSLLIRQEWWLRLLGGLFLCYLGLQTFRAAPAVQAAPASARGLLGAYLSTFLLTLTNPATILSFTLVFAGMGLASATGGDYGRAAWLVLGVFAGSALWWLLLSSAVAFFRGRLQRPCAALGQPWLRATAAGLRPGCAA